MLPVRLLVRRMLEVRCRPTVVAEVVRQVVAEEVLRRAEEGHIPISSRQERSKKEGRQRSNTVIYRPRAKRCRNAAGCVRL